jgi:hypothetical protein
MKMILTFHKNCKKSFPHKPEKEITVKSLWKAWQILESEKINTGYVNWKNQKGHHYIIKNGIAEDYYNYQKTLKTKTINLGREQK